MSRQRFKIFLLLLLRRIPLIRILYIRLLGRYTEGSIVTIKNNYLAGRRWKRSHHYTNDYWLGIHERRVQDAIVRELKPGDVFYDIGANAGFFSLLGAKCVGPGGKVFAFEPIPANAQALKENFSLNHFENISLVEAAVSNHQGRVELFPGRDLSEPRIMTEIKEGAEKITAPVVTLDEFCRNQPGPHLVKIDIEGAEPLALQGARNLLHGDRPPRFIIELHNRESARQVRTLLEEAEYTLLPLKRKSARLMQFPYHVLAVPNKENN